MKLLITVLSSILIIQIAHAQLPNDVYPDGKIAGKVSKIVLIWLGDYHYGTNIRSNKIDTGFIDTAFYDEKGYIISRHTILNMPNQKKHINYTYDNKYNAQGVLIESATVWGDQKIKSIFGNNGIITETVSSFPNGDVRRQVFTYDEKKKLIQCNSYNVDGNRDAITLYKYDKHNLLYAKYTTSPIPLNEFYSYSKFDKVGNWTKCTEKLIRGDIFVPGSDKPGTATDFYTVERQITYYH